MHIQHALRLAATMLFAVAVGGTLTLIALGHVGRDPWANPWFDAGLLLSIISIRLVLRAYGGNFLLRLIAEER
jgi:nicotinamide riboside transporter PnuC